MKRQKSNYWVFAGTTLLWGSVALVTASDGVSILDYMFYFFGGLIFGTGTVAIASVLLVRGLKRRERLIKLYPYAFVVQSIFLVIVFLGVSFNLAFAARFAVSQSALESVAVNVRSGVMPPVPMWIGLYRVKEIDMAGSSVRFIISDCGLDQCDVVYSVEGTPPAVSEDWYEHMKGSWWAWRRSWF